jgi:signal peptidase I
MALTFNWRPWLREQRVFLIFLLGLGVMRGALADWNPVPTGSMRPTVLEGDVVLVDKRAYDWRLPFTSIDLHRHGEPQRGDIVVAFSPADGTRLLKRLVALPGDTVAVVDGALWLNGEPVPVADGEPVANEPTALGPLPAWRSVEALPQGAQHAVQRLPVNGPLQHMAPLRLGPDTYFLMGDNRDNSADSRAFGPVPRHLLVGRVSRLLLSMDTGAWAPRWARFGQPLR